MSGVDFDATAEMTTAPALAGSHRASPPGVGPVWAALGVLTAALFAAQYVTLVKIKNLLLAQAPNDTVLSIGARAWRKVGVRRGAATGAVSGMVRSFRGG